MATAERILALAQAALNGDRKRIVSTCRILMSEERPNSALKARLERLLHRNAAESILSGEDVPPDLKGLVLQVRPALTLADVVLPQDVQRDLDQFLAERSLAGTIRDAGITVPHRILLSGPPGNGKTTLAGAVAAALGLPFLVLDFSAILSSYMGETGARLAKVFRGLGDTPAVLFVDELETVLSERASVRGKGGDVGEIARVVSTLLLEIDRLSDQLILIGATNHGELLDRAVVRRFDHHWELPAPDEVLARRWLERFARRYPTFPVQDYAQRLIEDSCGSLSNLERETEAWCRRWIVEQSQVRQALGKAG